MAVGTIKSVLLDKGFGFISQPGAPDVFFHRNDLPPDLPFDVTLEQRRIEFTIQQTPRGTRAIGIMPARD